MSRGQHHSYLAMSDSHVDRHDEHTFIDLTCPQIDSPSPTDDRSRRNSRMASLLYIFPSESSTIGSRSGRWKRAGTLLR